ncbi:MAG: hypothetical protein NVSMB29_00900 [Candidatus Dormibacteria bacterium]
MVTQSRGKVIVEGQAPAPALLRYLPGSARRALSTASSPIWVLNGSLIAIATSLYFAHVRYLPAPGGRHPFAWLVFPVLFFITEVAVVHLEFRREAHTFSLSEMPYVLGLFLLAPALLVPAQLIGTAVALTVIRRQSPVKLIFNLSNFAVETCLALLTFHAIGVSDDPTDVRNWGAAFAAVAVAVITGIVTIAVAISLSERQIDVKRWGNVLLLALGGGLANASLGVLLVYLITHDIWLFALLAAPVTLLLAAYRAYFGAREKHRHVEFLLEAGEMVQRADDVEGGIVEMLAHSMDTFRAQVAELTLFPAADEAGGVLHTSLRGETRPTKMVRHLPDEHERALFNRLTQTRSAILLSSDDPDVLSVEGAWFLQSRRVKDAMLVPLLGETRMLGVITLAGRLGDVSRFKAEDLRLLSALAAHASVTLENGQLERSLVRLTEMQEELSHLAFHDPLTGLANRTLFRERLDHAAALLARESSPLAVVFIDLDDFKTVNDSLGHAAGDRLLIEVSRRLQRYLRTGDTAARFGGDEFALLLEGAGGVRYVVGVVERLLAALVEPIPLDNGDLIVHASIGIVVAEAGRPADTEELLRHADVAMYTAKARGKGGYAVFEPDMQATVIARHNITTELRHSIERHEFDLLYQPIVSLSTGNTVGVEALIRWMHPTRGLVLPNDFIPIAEETGLILPLGRFILEQACHQAVAWSARDEGDPGYVSVNLSAHQLRQPSFLADLRHILDETGVHPESLLLEVTESVVIDDVQAASRRLSELRELGLRIAMDDFGTGFSSLSVLRDLPIDVLKIAKPFVERIDASPRDEAFVNAILRLADCLELDVIAEGVERHEQARRLHALGCRLAQGYRFSRPQTPAQLEVIWGGAATSSPSKGHYAVLSA